MLPQEDPLKWKMLFSWQYDSYSLVSFYVPQLLLIGSNVKYEGKRPQLH